MVFNCQKQSNGIGLPGRERIPIRNENDVPLIRRTDVTKLKIPQNKRSFLLTESFDWRSGIRNRKYGKRLPLILFFRYKSTKQKHTHTELNWLTISGTKQQTIDDHIDENVQFFQWFEVYSLYCYICIYTWTTISFYVDNDIHDI